VSRSMHTEQGESFPYNHHLRQFPDFPQKRERVRRRHDCQPRTFAETLSGRGWSYKTHHFPPCRR
jgi:hypothetical protein